MCVCVLKSVALLSCLVKVPLAEGVFSLLYVLVFPTPFSLRQKENHEQEFLVFPFAAAVLGFERRLF